MSATPLLPTKRLPGVTGTYPIVLRGAVKIKPPTLPKGAPGIPEGPPSAATEESMQWQYLLPDGDYRVVWYDGWIYAFPLGTSVTILPIYISGKPVSPYVFPPTVLGGWLIDVMTPDKTYYPLYTIGLASEEPRIPKVLVVHVTGGTRSIYGSKSPAVKWEDPWPGERPIAETPPIVSVDPLTPEDPWGNDLGINLTDRERGLFGSRNPRGLGEIFGHLLPGHGGGGKTTPSGPGSRSSADPAGGGGGGGSPSDGGRGDVWSDPGDPGGSSPTTTPTAPEGSGGGDLDIAGVVEAAQSGAGTGSPSVDDSSGTISGQKPDGSWSKPQRFPKLRPDPSDDGPVTSADPIALVVTGAALKLGASMMGRLRAPRSDGPLDDGERRATGSGSTKVRPVDPALDPVPYAVNASTAGGGGSVGGLTQVGVGSGPIRALRPDLDSPNERGRTDEATTIVDRFTTIAGAGGTLGGTGDPVAGGGVARTVRGGVLTSADGKSRR